MAMATALRTQTPDRSSSKLRIEMRSGGGKRGRVDSSTRPQRSAVTKAVALVLLTCLCILAWHFLGRATLNAAARAPSAIAQGMKAESKLPVQRRAPRETSLQLVSPPSSRPAVESPPPPASRPDEQQAWIEVLSCWDRRACPAGTVCWQGDDGQLGCFESNCQSVEDREKRCAQGQACRAVDKTAGIYRCVPSGRIALGGSCLDPMLAKSARNCAAGLNCVNTICRRPCDPAATATCSAGEVCVQQTVRDWACVPGCSSDAECAPLACIRKNAAARGTCVAVPQGTCRPDRPESCPARQACDYSIVDGRMLMGTCRPACASNRCPGGSTCWTGFDSLPSERESGGVCLQSCSAGHPECPPDHVCMALDANATTWGCRRAAHDARPGVDIAAARGSFANPVARPARAAE
jgi:hypothetical protein